MTTRKLIKIDIISDFLCPWCYLGHDALDRGMKLVSSAGLPVDFSIRYYPFFLATSGNLKDDVPMSKADFYERKLGSEKWESISALVIARAAQDGLNFKFGGNVRQTTRAHRLVLKAYQTSGQAVQLVLLKKLFRAFFEEEQDIGDEDTLAAISCSPDVMLFPTPDDAREWILGNEYLHEVRTLSADAQRKGVAGVPFVVIDGRWAVTGCQTPICYFKIFEKIANTEPHETLFSSAPTPKPETTCPSEFEVVPI